MISAAKERIVRKKKGMCSRSGVNVAVITKISWSQNLFMFPLLCENSITGPLHVTLCEMGLIKSWSQAVSD